MGDQIAMNKSEGLKPRYFVINDVGDNVFFQSPEQLLKFLENNDPTEAGCKLMTDAEFEKIEPDES